MSNSVLDFMNPDELRAEVVRLRKVLAEAGVNLQQLRELEAGTRTRLHQDLSTSRAETAEANRKTAAVRVNAERAAQHDRSRLSEAETNLASSHDIIAELHASRTALAYSEARQRAIFESAADIAMVVTDTAGLITDWNLGAERAMGWAAQEMQGQDAVVIFTPEDRAAGQVDKEMRQALSAGRASDERWHLRKDGERFWASGEMMPLVDANKIHLGFVKILRDRTAEHLSGVSLKETQERYRLAAKATNDAVWDWDITNDRVLWNEALGQAYGYTFPGSETGSDWRLAQIHENERVRIAHSMQNAIDGDVTVWSDEYRFMRADGSYAQVLDRGHIIRNGSGRALRMIGAMLDLTVTRRAEAALRRSEERFRTVLDTIDVAFAIVQVKFYASESPIDYRFVEANPAFERQAGVDLRGKWVTEFAPNLERFWFETYGHVAKTGKPAAFENYAEAFGRWFDVRAVRVGDPADRQIAILFNDSTERRMAEERLRINEALLRENVQRVQLALAAGAIIGTWHWDLPTDRFTVDEGFAGAFGLDPALGRKGLSLEQVVATVHPDDREGLSAAINEAIARGGAYAHQYRVCRANGMYHWIEANGRVDLAPDGEPLSFPGVLIDVQDRRGLVEERDRALNELRDLNETLEQRVTERSSELMRAEDALRQSQKMEAVGQLNGGLAHDFNNLLAGISGSLELMGVRINQGRLKDLEKYMIAAQGAAKRAASLTHRLLAFSRRQTLDPKATDVNALITGMLDLFRRTVGPSVAVEFVARPDLWAALVDPSQLENALLNLCINARDAMADGGRIIIETEHRLITGHQAEMRDMLEGQYLALSVSDNGSGMPPDVLARAFEPFFTTKPTGQGTGLGLSMIYGFAKQSGGQVRIHSVVGQGTTITIFLPRHLGQKEIEEGSKEETLLPMAEAGESVLVVDDEPTVRMLVIDVLNDLGYTAIEAADGPSGLKCFSRTYGSIC